MARRSRHQPAARHGGPANIDERSPAMDNVSVRDARKFFNLNVERPRMHLLDEPTGYISAIGKANLGHQMRYSVERLEAELADDGEPRVLQLVCEGDEHEPRAWTLYADGLKCAHGTGEFARACFCEAADAFMGVCREAVRAAALPSRSKHDYDLLRTARRIAAAEAERRAASKKQNR